MQKTWASLNMFCFYLHIEIQTVAEILNIVAIPKNVVYQMFAAHGAPLNVVILDLSSTLL